MKFRLLIRITVIVCVILLCMGFGVYSFLRLDAVERQKDFNLYTLVPQDAIAVFETHRVADLVEEIHQMNCSKDNRFLHISELFVYLKKHLSTLADDTPHGLSKQMNKILISFHAPDTPMNQVLYCSLGADDYQLVESIIRKYNPADYPSRKVEYKGEEMCIYPMSDGRFLAAYFTSDFLVVSLQKRLVEQVIDAYQEKKTLMALPSFRSMYAAKHTNLPAKVYIRLKTVPLGRSEDTISANARLGSWAEFDMKFAEDAVYCSGTSHESDSSVSFINALRKQHSIEGFMGDRLPATTFFYNHWAISDKKVMLDFTSGQEYAKTTYSDSVKQCDKKWIGFLTEYAGTSVMSCLFRSKDSTDLHPCAVMGFPIKDELQAQKALQELLYVPSTSKEVAWWQARQIAAAYALYPKARKVKLYFLAQHTLLAQLTGITQASLYSYACFYKGMFLSAPDARSLVAYIDALENGEVLAGKPLYEEGVGSLSSAYNFVMMADMEAMLHQPEAYVRLVPNFFFRQSKFFRHFTICIQFTCTDNVVYPNIVLFYKGQS